VGETRLLPARDEMAPSTPTPDKDGRLPTNASTTHVAIGRTVMITACVLARNLKAGDMDACLCFSEAGVSFASFKA
jgi:hypothetical protein